MPLTTELCSAAKFHPMTNRVVQIHGGKQPRRPHHIADYAERRGLTQADLAREIGADKSVVSRWYSGASPSMDWQQKLAEFFEVDREALFRHPDDDWLTRFFADRNAEEVDRMKQLLEAAFPRKRG